MLPSVMSEIFFENLPAVIFFRLLFTSLYPTLAFKPVFRKIKVFNALCTFFFRFQVFTF